MMSDKPVIAGREPMAVEVEEGKIYWWCTCGRSANQPFCDGSHKGTEFAPEGWEAPKPGKVFMCTCTHTGTSPLCDESHNTLD